MVPTCYVVLLEVRLPERVKCELCVARRALAAAELLSWEAMIVTEALQRLWDSPSNGDAWKTLRTWVLKRTKRFEAACCD